MGGKPRLNHKVAVSAKEKHKAALSAIGAASSFRGVCCCIGGQGTLGLTARYPAWDQFCQLCIDRRLQCDHQMTASAALTLGSITWHSVPFYGSSHSEYILDKDIRQTRIDKDSSAIDGSNRGNKFRIHRPFQKVARGPRGQGGA